MERMAGMAVQKTMEHTGGHLVAAGRLDKHRTGPGVPWAYPKDGFKKQEKSVRKHRRLLEPLAEETVETLSCKSHRRLLCGWYTPQSALCMGENRVERRPDFVGKTG